jgi:hypothetical protein
VARFTGFAPLPERFGFLGARIEMHHILMAIVYAASTVTTTAPGVWRNKTKWE